MNNQPFSLDNHDFSNISNDKFKLNLKPQKNQNELYKKNHNNHIVINKEIDNSISSPFNTDSISTNNNFDEEKIREKLKEILPKNCHHLINKIINDKKYYFPNDIKVEKGVFRDKEGNLLQLIYGDKKGFKIPDYIREIGFENGIGILSHNHVNGLVILSIKDIISILSLQSSYNPIYSPSKTSLLINKNILQNKNNIKEISNRYEKFINNTNLKCEKLYIDEIKIIRESYNDKKLEKRLNDLYRPYYFKNQAKIAKEINILFEENNYDLKLYIL